MKKFEVFRYLKFFRYAILIVALLGSYIIYRYASKNQTYTASVVVEYANESAASGTTPDGSPIDVSEIYSAAVITDAINEMGLNNVYVDTIRPRFTVTPIIPEEEQELKAALLEKGEPYEYFPTRYEISATFGSGYSLDFARNIVDAVVSNYFTFYSEKYIDTATSPNNIANVSTEKYDYLECLDLINSTSEQILSNLLSKSSLYPGFSSTTTGYSFQDLADQYQFIVDNTVAKIYADVLDKKLTSDRVGLVTRYQNVIANYEMELVNTNQHIAEYKKLLDQFGAKIVEGAEYNFSINDTANSGQNVIMNIEEWWNANKKITTTTTYDDMISNYVALKTYAASTQLKLENARKTLATFSNPSIADDKTSDTAKRVAAEIQSVTEKLNALYGEITQTNKEFNEFNGAKNLSVLSSIYTKEGINVKIYVAMALLLFLVVGCCGAVLLGRLGDFIDYSLYTDRKTGIANRTKCDLYIKSLENRTLPDDFAIAVFKLTNLRELNTTVGRQQGDLALREFGAILKKHTDAECFVGYNEREQYLVFHPACSAARMDETVQKIKDAVLAHNAESEAKIECAAGRAESSADATFEIRALLRKAISRSES